MYRLPDIAVPLDFPNDFRTTEEGLLAVGGNLLPQTLVNAYAKGIFPWYSQGDPLLWWHPDPRLVLIPNQLHVSRSLRKIINHGDFTVTFNRDFDRVISDCAAKRAPKRDSTWILPEIKQAYRALFEAGFAQSVEVWDRSGRFAGGMYGVAIGRVFFGESMVSHATNASKVALFHLCEAMTRLGYLLLDCQVTSTHLMSLGAQEVTRGEFLDLLRSGASESKLPGSTLTT